MPRKKPVDLLNHGVPKGVYLYLVNATVIFRLIVQDFLAPNSTSLMSLSFSHRKCKMSAIILGYRSRTCGYQLQRAPVSPLFSGGNTANAQQLGNPNRSMSSFPLILLW
jgi:hypothetical protein